MYRPIDEVPDFACSYDCVLRQFISLSCKSVGEKLEKLDRECNQTGRFGICGFDKGVSCALLNYPISDFVTIYDKCYSFFEKSNVTNRVCPSECSEALLDAKDTYGCCLKYYNSTFNDEAVGHAVMKSDLWAACDIETLDSCVILPPPDDFLNKCSQESGGGGGGTIHVSLTNMYSIVVIVTTLFITTQPCIT